MKEWINKWNPFNSDKIFAHIHRWRTITKGEFSLPILVTIDPTNICNLKCIWCNAKEAQKNRWSMSKKAVDEIILFMNSYGKYKIETACIAGGGEPFCNPRTYYLLRRLNEHHIKIGIVTNGSIDLSPELKLCEWIGVSVDAGAGKTYGELKSVDPLVFKRVIRNVAELVSYHLPSGITYKFLVHPDNIREMYIATLLAKELGCKYIHFRPVGISWNDVNKGRRYFMRDDIRQYNEMITECYTLSDDSFGVIGQVHKYDENFSIKHNFQKCYAPYMTCVIGPAENSDSFTASLCCDRRGDKKLELGTFNSGCELLKAWGGHRHVELTNAINLEDCPRCTYSPHNELFENVILKNKMNEDFI